MSWESAPNNRNSSRHKLQILLQTLGLDSKKHRRIQFTFACLLVSPISNAEVTASGGTNQFRDSMGKQSLSIGQQFNPAILNDGLNTFNVITIGQNGPGDLVVSGVGAELRAENAMNIGFNNIGNLTIDSGGIVRSLGGPSPFCQGCNYTIMGNAAGAVGTIIIRDPGSQFLVGHDTPGAGFIVGNIAGSIANVYVQNGAMMTTTRTEVGGESNSQGTVNVSGIGSTWSVTTDGFRGPELVLGRNGSGTLNITSGGQVNAGSVRIGSSSSSGRGTGIAMISGVGSNLTMGVNGPVFVGSGGSGTLSVLDGAKVLANQPGGSQGFLSITSSLPSAPSTVNVDGLGSVISAPRVFVSTGGNLTISNFGKVETSFGIVVGNGGVLLGNSVVSGGVTVGPGGVVQPGLSPGDLTVIGDFNMKSSGTLRLEIGQLAFDRVLATGHFNLASGKIEFAMMPGAHPNRLNKLSVGDFLRSIVSEGEQSSAGVIGVNLFGLSQLTVTLISPEVAIQSFNFDSTTGIFTVVAPSAVPVPPAIWMLIPGLIGIWARRRRVLRPG